MYEEVAPKRRGAFRDIFLTVIFGFLLLSLPNWGSLLQSLFRFPYLLGLYEFFVIASITLLIFRYLRNYGVEYKYSLIDDALIIRVGMGAREQIVVQAFITSASELIPYSESAEVMRANRWNERKISYGVSDKKQAYLFTFPPNQGNSALIFQPSEKFVAILKQKLLDKRSEM